MSDEEMGPLTPEESARLNARVEAATELIERAYDDARDVVYGNGFYGNLAHLVDIYCRRAAA